MIEAQPPKTSPKVPINSAPNLRTRGFDKGVFSFEAEDSKLLTET
jgi:hypothetical protein